MRALALLLLAAPSWAAVRPVALPRSPALSSRPVSALAATPALAAAPARLIITGPPGSGKGTLAEKIAEERGLAHISGGELLRAYARDKPDVAAVMARGRLVDAALVMRLLEDRLSRPDAREKGFILDGFPRRPAEAAALERLLGGPTVDAVIVLDVPENELLRRIKARGRADDKPEVFRERMKIYREQTVPAVARFLARSPVVRPKIGPTIAGNWKRLKKALVAALAR